MEVIILLTDDDRGLYSIYEESGQILERDFVSYLEAMEYANDQGWIIVDIFNVK